MCITADIKHTSILLSVDDWMMEVMLLNDNSNCFRFTHSDKLSILFNPARRIDLSASREHQAKRRGNAGRLSGADSDVVLKGKAAMYYLGMFYAWENVSESAS